MVSMDRYHRTGFFAGMDKEDVDILQKLSSQKHFKKGQVIYRQGDDASCFCIIQNGKVAIEMDESNKEPMLVQVLGKGDVFGLCWLFPPYANEYTARVEEDCTLYIYDTKKIQQYFMHNTMLKFELTRRFSMLLNNRLHAIRSQLMMHIPEREFTPPEVYLG